MTLIITWLTPFGTIMAGDSTLTKIRKDRVCIATPDAATKVFWHERLRCGLSAWGRWQIRGQMLHDWLSDYIDQSQHDSLQDLANDLAARLARAHGRNNTGYGRCGIHVSGYEELGAHGLLPSFFHVHDGPSEGPGAAGQVPCRTTFEAVHDVTPQYWLATGTMYITRNGDFENFAAFQAAFEALRSTLRFRGVEVPYPVSLESLADFAVFQLNSIIEIYRMSNLVPGIGGRIDLLTFDARGLIKKEKR